MNLLKETARIVVEYVKNNPVPTSELTVVLQTTYYALVSALQEPSASTERPVPAMPIKKSVTASHVVCLECGKRFKMLKRHLSIDHGLTIDEYRNKWQLPGDYPMVAPDYAERRSELAYRMGLGTKRKKGFVAGEESEGSAQGAGSAPAPVPRSGRSGYRYPTSRWSQPSGK
ncbi:MAG: transcriptional regulatory protein Ro [Rhodospirillaceae bacterium]|nr:MAG: transcriptional regulatory protein Ro [Rhodospirillaceae bacterium]